MEGFRSEIEAWSVMLHGDFTLARRWDPRPRGEAGSFLTNMLAASARRELGPGWLELTARASIEPVMGPRGYPLLLQTGESADGILPLVDRQHPHDALVELSVSYRVEIDEGAWAFLYAAPVGSPAFGPVPYMHRSSGSVNPVTPISHHFLDATHVTHGVITAGVFDERIVAEASWLNGREPDAIRWTTEIPRLDSWSVRFTWLAGRDWAVQASHGLFREPERLHPGIDARKSSVSVTHHRSWGSTVTWSTTAASVGVQPHRPASRAHRRGSRAPG
jgi:hypothetical protein